MHTMFVQDCLLCCHNFFHILIQEKEYFGISPDFVMVSSHGYLTVSKSFIHADCVFLESWNTSLYQLEIRRKKQEENLDLH